jgi:Ca-activated chloride channel family protein
MRYFRFVLILLISATVIAAQDREFTLKVDVSLVSVDVGVFDAKNQPVMTLGKEDFEIYEDGEPQITRSFSTAGAPFNILLLVDRSGSMRTQWSFIIDALNRLIGKLRSKDHVAIAMFDSFPELVMNWRSAVSENREQINIGDIRGGTDVYEALAFSARTIRSRPGRKAVVAYTDGIDEHLSQASSKDYKLLLQAAQDSEAAFFFIGIDPSGSGQARIKDIAKSTGGNTYFPRSSDEVGPLYEKIAIDLANSYSLGYTPEKPLGGGEFRKIEVRPLDVRLHVTQSRDGYYAR